MRYNNPKNSGNRPSISCLRSARPSNNNSKPSATAKKKPRRVNDAEDRLINPWQRRKVLLLTLTIYIRPFNFFYDTVLHSFPEDGVIFVFCHDD
jgi:hypothetical protein